MTGHRWRWITAGVGLVALLVLVGVAAVQSRSDQHLRHLARTTDYLPGVAADVFLPTATTRAPVVVLVPGGAWLTADRTGLRPLADDLADHGMVAVAATYRAANDGVRFPVPVSDIVCAIDFSVSRARHAGITPGPVIVLGHSSGGQLAALAALATAHFRAACPYPAAHVDGFIGLAGGYDITALQAVAEPLFGVPAAEGRAVWRAGDPTTWLRADPGLRVLLAHGDSDTTLSPALTESFARRLGQAGHQVQVEMVRGADHDTIYRPGVIADRIIAWIGALAGT